MSKIAIISQPDQGVLIDVGGCGSLQEAASHLSNTLQVSNQFWKGTEVALNFGTLELTPPQVAQLLAIAKAVGATPKQVFSENEPTRASLRSLQMKIGRGKPMKLPEIKIDALTQHELEEEEDSNYTEVSGAEAESMTLYETEENLEFNASLTHDTVPSAEAEDDATAAADTATAGDAVEEVKITQEFIDEAEEVDGEVDAEEEEEEEEERIAPPKPTTPPVPAVLYLRQHLRSGQTVSHKGHLVIIGDVNPGAEVMAEGDVTVWGALRGIAHAGIGGNTDAEIRALKMQPIQIRIAHAIARSPDKPRYKFSRFANSGPETARIIDGKIKIAKSNVD
ncbi:MAG: septum site-determining protein MinC [Cyanobacteria bacterium SZAS-4]|nr:septum site-determining protein MinC [Cyanobacteria bacterium SZAS-4]